jgi:hypothetical protein
MNSKADLLRRRLICVMAVALFWALPLNAAAQIGVQDVFGRSLNQHGITLVDWDGYMANPLIKVYLFAPTNAALPGSATLTASGARLYFNTPSTVSSNGPSKSVSITSAGVGVPVQLSTFPDRDSASEDYTLTVVFSDAHSARQTNTVPIHVMDLDLQRTNEFVVTANFDRDATGVFTNALRRLLASQAANDWTYFFTCGRDRVWGGPATGDPKLDTGPGTRDTVCTPVSGSEGKEPTVMKCCNDTANSGPFCPGGNDCHTSVDNCLCDSGLAAPPHPRVPPPVRACIIGVYTGVCAGLGF